MELKISSAFEVNNEIKKYKNPFALIGITSNHPDDIKRYDIDNTYCRGILKLNFDDSDPNYFTIQKPKLFSDVEAELILNFLDTLRKYNINNILVHCLAGISRSSAIAAGLSVICNGFRTDNWIFNSSKYIPNMHVYRTLLNYAFKKGYLSLDEYEKIPQKDKESSSNSFNKIME